MPDSPSAFEDLTEGVVYTEQSLDPPRRLRGSRSLWQFLWAMAIVTTVSIFVTVTVGWSFVPSTLFASSRNPTAIPRTPYQHIRADAGRVVLGQQWQSVPLPTAVGTIFAFTPATQHVNTLYLCAQSTSIAPFAFWQSTDGGQNWETLPLPSTVGSSCSITIDPVNDADIVTTVYQRPGTLGGTSNQITVSRDGGKTWRAATLPLKSPPTDSHFQMLPRGGHLYYWLAWVHFGEQFSHFERSDDFGASWKAADTMLGSNSLFTPQQIGSSMTFLASVFNWQHPTNKHRLWRTDDGGDTWTDLGSMDPGSTTLVTSQFVDHPIIDAQQPLYQVADHGIFQTTDLHQWTMLPSVVADNARHIEQIIAVLPTNNLLVLADTGPQQLGAANQHWLWVWHPTQLRWEGILTPLIDTNTETCYDVFNNFNQGCWSTLLVTPATSTDILGTALHKVSGSYLFLVNRLYGWQNIIRVFIQDNG